MSSLRNLQMIDNHVHDHSKKTEIKACSCIRKQRKGNRRSHAYTS